MAGGEKDNDVLAEVEHYHNQFYIQQINIHDLKQAIKQHDRRLQLEEQLVAGQQSPETIQEHKELHSQYEVLKQTLNELRSAFMQFAAKA
jgi:ABC-type phosphate transport system auxiliary subunit